MTDQYNYKLFEVLDHDKLIYICIVIGFCSCDQSTHQVVCILKEEPLKQKHHSQQHWHEGSIDGIWGNGLQGGKAQSLQSGAALVDGSKVIKQNLSPTKTSSPRASSLAWLISDSFFLVPLLTGSKHGIHSGSQHGAPIAVQCVVGDVTNDLLLKILMEHQYWTVFFFFP